MDENGICERLMSPDLPAQAAAANNPENTGPSARAKRVGILCDDAVAGGTFVMSVTLTRSLRKIGWKVELFAPDTPVNRRKSMRLDVKIHALPDYVFQHPASDLRCADAAGWLRHQPLDRLIFSNCNTISMIAAKQAARSLNLPYYTWLHLVEPDEPDLFALTYRKAILSHRGGSGVVCVSAMNARLYVQSAPSMSEYVSVIRNGIDVLFERPVKDEAVRNLRSELGIDPQTALILCPARFERRKGIDRLLLAFESLHQRNVSARLVLCGSDPENMLEHFLASVSDEVRSQITALPHQDEIIDYLDAADIVVLASRREGLPLTVLEAMARGRPVVATAAGGTGEALNNEVGALIANAHEEKEAVQALADALQRFVQSATVRQLKGERARQRFTGLFRAERMAHEHIEVLSGLKPEKRLVKASSVAIFLLSLRQMASLGAMSAVRLSHRITGRLARVGR